MLNLIFAELADGILKDMICKREKETSRNPFLRPVEAEIERLENIEEQVETRLQTLKQLHHLISGIFYPPEKAETDSPQNPEGTEVPPESGRSTSAPAEKTVPASKPKRGRKPKNKAKPEYQRLPKHRATGNPRLDALEAALRDALERLNNTKLAFYVKDIKEVRQTLDKLYKSWDKRGEERLPELESGLKAAADKLSANSRAGKSKIMQNIWSNIIVALQNKDSN